MAAQECIKVIVRGLVQGVYFRAFVEGQAVALGIKGYTRNLPSGNEVEVIAEGSVADLESLIEQLRRGPAGSRVDRLDIQRSQPCAGFTSFEIRY